jgi:UDP-glucose 4-epimerase
LGTGKGTSVLEMVAAFEKASGKVKRKKKFPVSSRPNSCTFYPKKERICFHRIVA